MKALLDLITQEPRLSDAQVAERVGLTAQEVTDQRTAWEATGKIMGYRAIIKHDADSDYVSAFIEVKITPERGGGFDSLASRIAKFDEVSACYLVSGGYDLLLLVTGSNIHDIARFVSERLSTIAGVLSCSTHFHLKTYKKMGCFYESQVESDRLIVSP